MMKPLKGIKINKKKEWKYFTGIWIAVAAAVLLVLLLLLMFLFMPYDSFA